MSKGRFLEGVIIGAALGVFGTLLLMKEETIEEKNITDSGAEKKTKTTQRKINKENTDIMISKTLETIGTGFAKISKILDEQKSNQSGNTNKVNK